MVTLYLLCCILVPKQVAAALRDKPGEVDGLASISIAFTSILQMAALSLVPRWGGDWGHALLALWWLNTGLAVLASVGIPFVNIKLRPPGVGGLTPAAQLPLIAALTAAAGAGTVCQHAGVGADLQAPAVAVACLLVGLGLPLALALDTLYLARVLDRPRGVPPPSTYQDMILCGPWGQGSFALQGLGQTVLRGGFTVTGGGVLLTSQAAAPVAYSSIFAGLQAWELGTFWWIFVVSSLLTALLKNWPPKKMEFQLVMWSIVFPWGVYTNAAVQLGKMPNSPAMRVWSTLLAIVLVIVWLSIAALTLGHTVRHVKVITRD